MGASQSKSETDENVFSSETPIAFSRDVVNHLSDQLESPETSPERQSTLDANIRLKIQNKIDHLRQEEDQVRKEIELALEKENLDREKGLSDDGSEGSGPIPSSAELMGDLEDIRSKVDRYQSRRNLTEFPDVKSAGEAVVACYRANVSTSLDCWKEVSKFKESVTHLEEQYFKSLQ